MASIRKTPLRVRRPIRRAIHCPASTCDRPIPGAPLGSNVVMRFARFHNPGAPDDDVFTLGHALATMDSFSVPALRSADSVP